MAAGQQLRKVARWSVVVIAVAGLTAFLFRDPLSLAYHKHRLVAAKARHWRLTTQGYSFWDHVTEIVRGRPVAADEAVAVWKAHEDALVRQGFLKRQVFVSKTGVLPSRSNHPDYNTVLARMEES